MMHTACSSIEEVPYCFSRSSVKFHGHTAEKIVDFNPDNIFKDILLNGNCMYLDLNLIEVVHLTVFHHWIIVSHSSVH